MKHLLLVLALIFVGTVGFAKPLDTPFRAQRVKKQIAPTVMELAGAIGIGGCDPQTGEENVSADFVYCVWIGAQTPEAYAVLSQLYPVGTQIDGVFVAVEYIGRIEAQPRLSVGF